MSASFKSSSGWARLGGYLLGVIVLVGFGAILFAWSGLYSVAASEGHLAVVDKFLRFGMKSSVQTHARDIKAPDLSDPDLVRLGAGHYYSGCMPCHAAPGHAANAVFQHSLPAPPNLRNVRDTWRDRELFWLIKHGLKYTGMPGWSARDRNDEQWAVVAFLKRLPDLTKPEYEQLALGGWSRDRVANDEPSKTFGADLAQCARCHGDAQRGPASALVPDLAGQSEAYLLQALNDYAAGSRQSGIMQPIASTLSEEQRARYARYYAQGKPKSAARSASGGGAQLAAQGDAARAIPACDSCHGADRHQSYPSLAGQPAKYLVAQLKLWRSGPARTGPLAAIMAPVAAKLLDGEIDALAAHYAAGTESGGP
jgi:cytochrome c553